MDFRVLALLLFYLFYSPCFALWPQPVRFDHGNQTLWLSPSFVFVQDANSSNSALGVVAQVDSVFHTSLNPTLAADPRLQEILERAREDLLGTRFVPWKFYPRNTDFSPELSNSSVFVNTITVTQLKASGDNASFSSYGDESYTLTISVNGSISIVANTILGINHALSSLKQLFYYSSSASSVYTPLAPVYISDSPRFKHRGLNLDVARNPFPISYIHKVITIMATCKLNQLHLHITDAQSWPLEIPSIPSLSSKGAYISSQIITASDLAKIQEYGVSLGVEVYLEIDLPGHTASIALSQPDLITAYDMQPDWWTYSAEPPSGQLRLTYPAVYNFTSTLFGDLLPRVSPYSNKFHTGGDEVAVNPYLLDPLINSNETATLQPLLQNFTNAIHAPIYAAGMTPVVWEEQIIDWNLTLPSNAIIQTWVSDASVLSIVQAGYRVIAGTYEHWYLDCGLGAWTNPLANTSTGQTRMSAPFLDWCNPVKNWKQVYTYSPIEGIPSDLTHLVLGGEVHLWTEQTDSANLERMLWPRAAAAAEVLWSGRTWPNGTERAIRDASPRLAEWRERVVVDNDVGAQPVQMVWCLMNPGSCEY